MVLGESWKPAKGSLFVESFREYYYSTEDKKLERDLRGLKEGLDQRSKETVDRVWERYCRQIPLSEYSHNYLESEEFYTAKEKTDSKRVYKEIQQVRKNVEIEGYIDPSTFCYDAGLRFVPRSNKYLRSKEILDIGAYNGDSILSLDKYGASRIVAYEPSQNNIERLKETLNKNPHRTDVEIVSKAVGDTNTEVHLSGEGSTATVKEGDGVEQIRIDDQDRGEVGFIKIDVEGYEQQVLEGALETIQRDRPVLSVSIYHHPEQFLSIKPFLQEKLTDYDFRIRKLNPVNPVCETSLLAYPSQLSS